MVLVMNGLLVFAQLPVLFSLPFLDFSTMSLSVWFWCLWPLLALIWLASNSQSDRSQYIGSYLHFKRYQFDYEIPFGFIDWHTFWQDWHDIFDVARLTHGWYMFLFLASSVISQLSIIIFRDLTDFCSS